MTVIKFLDQIDYAPKKKYGRHSGGVALYIRNDISSTFKQILTFSNGVNEVLSVYSEQENMFITVIYRQPNDSIHGHSSSSTEFNEILLKTKSTLSDLKSNVNPDIFILGDFNLPHSSWPEGNSTKGATKD